MLCRRLWVGFLKAVEAMRRVGDRRHLLHVLVGGEVQTIVERVNSMAFEAGDFASIRTLEYLLMFFLSGSFLGLGTASKRLRVQSDSWCCQGRKVC